MVPSQMLQENSMFLILQSPNCGSYYTSQIREGNIPPGFETRTFERGRKSSLTPEVEGAIREIVTAKRDLPIRSIAYKLATEHQIVRSNDTICRYLKQLGVSIHKSYIKPSLTVKQKIQRLEFVLGKLGPANQDARFRFFRDEKKTIHVDEKWFYVIQVKKRVRLFPGEEFPDDETTRHKSHIPKIMFLAAVGVPHRMPNGEWFDGKVGMWPFAQELPAVRGSARRPAGTIELKPFNVGAEEYLDQVIRDGGLLDAVRQKMSGYVDDTVVIQTTYRKRQF